MNEMDVNYAAWKIEHCKTLMQINFPKFYSIDNFGNEQEISINLDFLKIDKIYHTSSYKDILKKYAILSYFYSSQHKNLLNGYLKINILNEINEKIFKTLPILRKEKLSIKLLNNDIYVNKNLSKLNKEQNEIYSFRDLYLITDIFGKIISMSLFELCLFFNFFNDFKKANNELFLIINK